MAPISGTKRGLLTFEDFILALIIISIATTLIISNLFIFDHRILGEMNEQRKVWNTDIAADMIAKKYVDGHGMLNMHSFSRPFPDNVEIMVGGLWFGSRAPVAGNVYTVQRMVFVSGRAERLTVKTW